MARRDPFLARGVAQFDSRLVRWLRQQPGRCNACGCHIAEQGHHDACPLGRADQ